MRTTRCRRIDALFVLNLQVLAQIIDIYLEIIHDKRSRCYVCHKVIDVPAGHVVVSEPVSEKVE